MIIIYNFVCVCVMFISDDAELDSAISQFGDTKLPTAEEQQKYCMEKEQLDRINGQVEQLKETIASLEKWV